ncbi:enolase-phosphatase E1-like [Chironomus tepperi]|uniref:enolase-phosphatase E1-like n=1 Tax=Chironomus tepperi TaxID=113505 RepID=UPI00391EEF3D
MNEDEKLNKIEEEEEEDFSLSEDIVLSTRQHTSSESSRVGEKKKRKFKPGKFISKHLKIKKDEKKFDSGDTSETRSEDSLKSPKLGALRKSIAKKFSRKKKSQVSPLDSGESSQLDEPLNNEIDLAKEIEKLSKSYPNITISDQSETVEEKKINEDALELTKSIQTIDNKESSPIVQQASSPMLPNKKVQLQITISGKKIEKVQTTGTETMSTETIVSSKATDKASSPLQYYKSQTDIILPSVNTAVRVNKIREQFFNVMVSQNSNSTNKDIADEYMQHHTKSISSDALSQSVSRSTITQTTSQGSEENKLSQELIKSSVNSIISSANDLTKLDEKIEFPQNFPELKIVEESDQKEKEIAYKSVSIVGEIRKKFEPVTEVKNLADKSEIVVDETQKESEAVIDKKEDIADKSEIVVDEIQKESEAVTDKKEGIADKSEIVVDETQKESKTVTDKKKGIADKSEKVVDEIQKESETVTDKKEDIADKSEIIVDEIQKESEVAPDNAQEKLEEVTSE